ICGGCCKALALSEPLKMTCRKFKIGAELAQRVECIFMEEAERAFRDCFHLSGERARKGADRVFLWPAGKMARQKDFGNASLMLFIRHMLGKLGKIRIGQEGEVGVSQMTPEDPVELLSLQMIESALMKIVELAMFDVHAVDGDGGLAMFGAIA